MSRPRNAWPFTSSGRLERDRQRAGERAPSTVERGPERHRRVGGQRRALPGGVDDRPGRGRAERRPRSPRRSAPSPSRSEPSRESSRGSSARGSGRTSSRAGRSRTHPTAPAPDRGRSRGRRTRAPSAPGSSSCAVVGGGVVGTGTVGVSGTVGTPLRPGPAASRAQAVPAERSRHMIAVRRTKRGIRVKVANGPAGPRRRNGVVDQLPARRAAYCSS